MADLNVTNLFDLSYDQINAVKNKDITNHIKNVTLQLSTSVNNLMTEYGTISSQLMVVSNGNTLLVTCDTELDKQQAKMEQYSKRNNVETSGISHEVSDENLENKVIDICKESGIDLNPYDIETCHRLPSGHVNTSKGKHVIVKLLTGNIQKLCFALKNQ